MTRLTSGPESPFARAEDVFKALHFEEENI